MKKLNVIMMFLIVGIFVTVGSVMATPIFTGDPVANFGTGNSGLPTNPQGPGYYIWANDEVRSSWSVRWTGKDWGTGTFNWYDWAGEVSYHDGNINSASKVLWEAHDGDVTIDTSGLFDKIVFDAKAGPHWDGFDFTLTGIVGDYLTFQLGSDYFTLNNDGVYLGQNMVSVLDHCDNPTFFKGSGGTTRQFEVAAPAVPEPATMVLLGLGLLGLVGLRRKFQK
ncbi:PEP-CTERM protein-sorting domain-containing protein [Candidatus Magnetomoraceae bacterium gMMP-15]